MNIKREKLINCLWSSQLSFEDRAFLVFEYQRENNAIYKAFLTYSGRYHKQPDSIGDIPYFPISLFKTRDVRTGDWPVEQVFYSSGTTEMTRSKHSIRSLKYYHDNSEKIWTSTFGPLKNYEFVSLLPNYHDNPSSSLLSMVSYFMLQSRSGVASYYIDNQYDMYSYLERTKGVSQKVVLIGVSFALLNYGDLYRHSDMSHLIVIETGGMKRYREELTREELHWRLQEIFGGATICSEYGMTECLSQLYAVDGPWFDTNDQMGILISDPTDPFCMLACGRVGRVNIVDLANIDTLSFIATDDLGRCNIQGQVEILGRISQCDLRGCNYLI